MKKYILRLLKNINIEYQLLKKGSWGNLWNFRHGFLQSTKNACGISKSNYKNFISDRDYFRGHPFNKSYSSIIDNKLWLKFLLKDELEIIPTHFFFKDRFGFLDLVLGVRTDYELFLKTLKTQTRLVLKHTYSSGGKGFYLVEQVENKFFLNRKEIKAKELREKINSLQDYVVTDYIVQHKYAMDINSSSLNTIRFITYWDEKLNSFQIFSSFHRFGCNNSLVDNTGSGNSILIFINPTTGILKGDGIVSLDGKYEYKTDIEHPNSKILFSGIEIPHYLEARRTVLNICNKNSFLKFMGFDIAITEDGFKVIEINSRPGIVGAQQRIGFLSNYELSKILLQ